MKYKRTILLLLAAFPCFLYGQNYHLQSEQKKIQVNATSVSDLKDKAYLKLDSNYWGQANAYYTIKYWSGNDSSKAKEATFKKADGSQSGSGGDEFVAEWDSSSTHVGIYRWADSEHKTKWNSWTWFENNSFIAGEYNYFQNARAWDNCDCSKVYNVHYIDGDTVIDSLEGTRVIATNDSTTKIVCHHYSKTNYSFRGWYKTNTFDSDQLVEKTHTYIKSLSVSSELKLYAKLENILTYSIYLDTSKCSWDPKTNFSAYVYNDANYLSETYKPANWPGYSMTKVKDDLYKVSIEGSYSATKIIINNSNNGSQSADPEGINMFDSNGITITGIYLPNGSKPTLNLNTGSYGAIYESISTFRTNHSNSICSMCSTDQEYKHIKYNFPLLSSAQQTSLDNIVDQPGYTYLDTASYIVSSINEADVQNMKTTKIHDEYSLNSSESFSVILIIIVSSVSLLSLAGLSLFLYKKKKKHN